MADSDHIHPSIFYREWLVETCLPQVSIEWRKDAERLRLATLITWMPEVQGAYTDFWRDRRNRSKWNRHFYDAHKRLRFVPHLLDNVLFLFHEKGLMIQGAPPPWVCSPRAERIYRPRVESFALGSSESNGQRAAIIFIGTRFLSTRILDGLSRPEARSLREELAKDRDRLSGHPLISRYAQAEVVPIRNGVVESDDGWFWLGLAYEMRIFAEQPFLDVEVG